MKKLQVLLAVGFTMMAVNGFAQHTGKQNTTMSLNTNTEAAYTVKQLTPEEFRAQFSSITKSADNTVHLSLADVVSHKHEQPKQRQSLATMPVQGKDQPLRADNNQLQHGVSLDNYNQVK